MQCSGSEKLHSYFDKTDDKLSGLVQARHEKMFSKAIKLAIFTHEYSNMNCRILAHKSVFFWFETENFNVIKWKIQKKRKLQFFPICQHVVFFCISTFSKDSRLDSQRLLDFLSEQMALISFVSPVSKLMLNLLIFSLIKACTNHGGIFVLKLTDRGFEQAWVAEAEFILMPIAMATVWIIAPFVRRKPLIFLFPIAVATTLVNIASGLKFRFMIKKCIFLTYI